MMDSEGLLRLLRIHIAECVRSECSVAVAYSGGVDSAVVERIAREHAATTGYTCAVQGSHDYARVPVTAQESGLDLRLIVLDRPLLTSLVSKACHVLSTDDPLRVAYSVPVLGVIDASEQTVVLVGTGADELFGGYAKYLEDASPEDSMDVDIKKMQSENDVLVKYAKSVGKRLEVPFASPNLISFAKRLPIRSKLDGGERKVILREAAKNLGVISHDRPKKAAQYSSGVMKEMKLMARARGLSLREWTAETAAMGRRRP